MTDFTYIAINNDGKEVKGTVQANDEANIFTKDISIGGGVRVRVLSVFCRRFEKSAKLSGLVKKAMI